MDYQVDLAVFRGPLDLLLYLVKRNEVDICDIPIAQVAEQFLEYLRVLEMIDVEQAGDFLVMAATQAERQLNMARGAAATPREGTGERRDERPRREVSMEVGTPASGIWVASSANALMPRHGHLIAGTWARVPSLRRQAYHIPSRPRVAVADLAMVFVYP